MERDSRYLQSLIVKIVNRISIQYKGTEVKEVTVVPLERLCVLICTVGRQVFISCLGARKKKEKNKTKGKAGITLTEVTNRKAVYVIRTYEEPLSLLCTFYTFSFLFTES